jgi:hypothetical protein
MYLILASDIFYFSKREVMIFKFQLVLPINLNNPS